MTFNAAMLMIGLDKEHARVPTRRFRSGPPRAIVSPWLDWTRYRVTDPVEQLLFDKSPTRRLERASGCYRSSSLRWASLLGALAIWRTSMAS